MKRVHNFTTTETVLCGCGCNTAIIKYDKRRRRRYHVKGHRTNTKHSEETKSKISNAKKGTMPWNKGVKMSEEYCRINSESHKGIPATAATIRAAEVNKGRRYQRNPNPKTPYSTFKEGQWVGKKNINWKGGISKEIWLIRGSVESKNWQREVKRRDGFCCQKCGEKRHKKVTAHHIFNFSEYIELRFIVENGITFCFSCHKDFHKKYGYKNNNQQQVEGFIERTIEFN